MSKASRRRLADARRRKDDDDIAEALAVHANSLVREGRNADACAALDEAAGIHQAAGRVYDDARCTQFAGTLYRLDGHLDKAESHCSRVLALCDSQGPVAAAACAELGEIALARGDDAAAVRAFTAAVDAGPSGPARGPLLRRRAIALAAGGRVAEAIDDLGTAHDLLIAAGDRVGGIRALIERATAERNGGLVTEAEKTVGRAISLAQQDGDHAALADLQLLLAAEALDRRDPVAAMSVAQEARTEALAANAPTSYLGAAHAIAQLAEAAGDRLTAYAALATGWATLGDMVGGDLARTSFEPALRDMRERWGVEAFGQVQNSYAKARSASDR
jgi:tetratricopeptide (TPR) repeat protein